MFKQTPDNSENMNTTTTHNNHAQHHEEDQVETVVGPSVVVEGDFVSEGNILVKGTVSGNVKTGRLLTVEEGAKILANVKAGDAIISGEVQGNVKVDGKLELTASARLLGDISCETLVIEAGALLQGKVSMDGLEGMSKNEKKIVKRTKKTIEEDIESQMEA
ncbi:MAG: polymer-forming cytoskeletal protein [Patescibacteria group bacterium]|nr:polymer-forming cytoskeletal protein [Patescibacteria group bacterium]